MKLKIKMTGMSTHTAEIFIDGEKVENICGIEFNLNSKHIPEANIRFLLEDLDIELDEIIESEKFYSTEEAKDIEKLTNDRRRMLNSITEFLVTPDSRYAVSNLRRSLPRDEE